jgi:hypothetical protein
MVEGSERDESEMNDASHVDEALRRRSGRWSVGYTECVEVGAGGVVDW